MDEYLLNFNAKLQQLLLQAGCSFATVEGKLLTSPDLDDYWQKLAPEYLSDAVMEIADYPLVSLAWAGYLGMGVANGWDRAWDIASKLPYQYYLGSRGFDDMDERILGDILGVEVSGPAAEEIEDHLRSLAQVALSAIRHENIEPQSEMAYRVFAISCKQMFRMGASMELKRMGYKFQQVKL